MAKKAKKKVVNAAVPTPPLDEALVSSELLNGDHLAIAIWHVVRVKKLNVRWDAIRKLVSGLREEKYSLVADWVEKHIYQSEHLTNSCYILAFFDYLRDGDIVRLLDRAQEENHKEKMKAIEEGSK